MILAEKYSPIPILRESIEQVGSNFRSAFTKDVKHAIRETFVKFDDPKLFKIDKETAERVYNEVMKGGDDQQSHARWIAYYILAHGKDRISTFDIRRAFSTISDDVRAIEKATQSLEIQAWITPEAHRKALCCAAPVRRYKPLETPMIAHM